MYIYIYILFPYFIYIHTYTYMLFKYVFVDTVYMNVMRIHSEYEGLNYSVCDSIEEHLRFEQPCSCVAQRVREQDMSIENRYYGETICLNRVYTVK